MNAVIITEKCGTVTLCTFQFLFCLIFSTWGWKSQSIQLVMLTITDKNNILFKIAQLDLPHTHTHKSCYSLCLFFPVKKAQRLIGNKLQRVKLPLHVSCSAVVDPSLLNKFASFFEPKWLFPSISKNNPSGGAICNRYALLHTKRSTVFKTFNWKGLGHPINPNTHGFKPCGKFSASRL